MTLSYSAKLSCCCFLDFLEIRRTRRRFKVKILNSIKNLCISIFHYMWQWCFHRSGTRLGYWLLTLLVCWRFKCSQHTFYKVMNERLNRESRAMLLSDSIDLIVDNIDLFWHDLALSIPINKKETWMIACVGCPQKYFSVGVCLSSADVHLTANFNL